MTTKEELQALLDEMARDGVKVVYKDQSWFYRAIGKALYVLSFGKMKDFVTEFTTTIGKTIAVPRDYDQWSDERKIELFTHELTHVGQFKKYTLVGMAFLYLFVFFPVGLAYFRYRFERQAYLNGFKKELELYPSDSLLRGELIQHGVDQMTGPNYLWAWPFKKAVKAWFEKNL